MTRILVLTNMYPPHHLGGYELSCWDVVQRLRARGHEITVLTTTMRLPGVVDPPDERTSGVRRDLSFYWDDHKIRKPPLWQRAQIERDIQVALRNAIEHSRPEVVSAWNMGAMSLGLLTTVVEAGTPLVLNICDEWPIYAPLIDAWSKLFSGRPRLAALVRRRTGLPTTVADLGESAVFLYVSDCIRRKIETVTPWRPRVSGIVYSGIDPGLFPRSSKATRPWRWRLLHVGRIDERKGIHVAVEALRLLPDESTLEIAGRGDPGHLERLRRLVRKHGLEQRVNFTVSPREELAERYRAADVVVFPTIWDEPFGLVPVEAMACRTPVVATGTGGSGEFLLDGVNCLRIQPGEAESLAAAVRRLAQDEPLRRSLIEGGLRTADELTVDRLADVLEEWHEMAAAGFASITPPQRRLSIG